VGAVLAPQVVGVTAGAVDHRRAAGAGDAAVDAILDPLLGREEIGGLFGERAGGGTTRSTPSGSSRWTTAGSTTPRLSARDGQP
jgi:hypothetical protein